MHLHAPKPPHSWSDLFREVGVIAVGILLALAAEQVIEALRWREQVRIAEGGIKAELRQASILAYERLIIQPCLRGQIRVLHDSLAQPGPWAAAPMQMGTLIRSELPQAYRAPNRLFVADIWKNALVSGVIGHLTADRVAQLSSLYFMINELDRLQGEETRAASRLAAMSEAGDASRDTRIGLRGDLAEIDRINALMALTAQQLIEAQQSAHRHYDKAAIEKDRLEALTYDRTEHGACVADLPLDLG